MVAEAAAAAEAAVAAADIGVSAVGGINEDFR